MAVTELITFEKLVEFILAGSAIGIGFLTSAGFTVLGIITLILGVSALVFWLLVGIGGIVLWVWMFSDCLKRKFKRGNQKTFWIIILIITLLIGTPFWLHLIAASIYYFTVKKPGKLKKLQAKVKVKKRVKRKRK